MHVISDIEWEHEVVSQLSCYLQSNRVKTLTIQVFLCYVR